MWLLGAWTWSCLSSPCFAMEVTECRSCFKKIAATLFAKLTWFLDFYCDNSLLGFWLVDYTWLVMQPVGKSGWVRPESDNLTWKTSQESHLFLKLSYFNSSMHIPCEFAQAIVENVTTKKSGWCRGACDPGVWYDPLRYCHFSNSSGLGSMSLCHHKSNFKESKSWFDLVTDNPSWDCTNNKCCVNQGMTVSVRLLQLESCWEDELIDEPMFWHTFQQLNTCIACDMMS